MFLSLRVEILQICVCIYTSVTIPIKGSKKHSTSQSSFKIGKMFLNYISVLVCLPILSIQEPIRYGERVNSINDYPYVVRVAGVFIYTDSGEEERFTCTGVIYRLNIILTAAHCAWDPEAVLTSLVVRAGSIHLDDDLAQVVNVRGITVHEDYIHTKRGFFGGINYQRNDIALLWLESELIDGDGVASAILADQKIDLVNKYVTVVGWGLSQRDQITRQLKKVELLVLERRRAKKYYCGIDFPSTVYFAQSIDEKSTPTQGDSGSPLIYNNRVYGLTSFSGNLVITLTSGVKLELDDPESPRIFTKIYKFYDWIEKKRKQGPPTVQCTGSNFHCLL